MIRALGSVVAVTTREKTHSSQPAPNLQVRITQLTQLCSMQMSAHVDELKVELLSNDMFNGENILQTTLRTYIERVRHRGSYSRAVHTTERLTIQRMRTMGIDVSSARAILRGIHSVLDINQKYDTNELILEQIQQLKSWMERDRRDFSECIRIVEPLFAVTFSGLHLSHYALTYDNKTSFFIEELVAVDQDRNPILHAFCANQGNVDSLSMHRKNKPDGKDKASGRRRKNSTIRRETVEDMAKNLEATSIANYSAIGFSCVQQDAHFGWGGGGYSASVLYENFSSKFISNRHHGLSVFAKNVDLILSPNGIPKIVSNVLPLVGDLYEQCSEMSRRLAQHKQLSRLESKIMGSPAFRKRAKRSQFKDRKNLNTIQSSKNLLHDSNPLLHESEVKLSYDVSIACAHVVFAAFDDLLAEWALHKINLGFVDMINPRVDSGESPQKTATVKVEKIELHDLTEFGNKHPSVMWRERKCSDNVLTVKFCFEENDVDVNLSVKGLRMLYTARFVEDFSIFVCDHFVDIIRSSFSSLNDTMDLVAEKQKLDHLPPIDLVSIETESSTSEDSGDESSVDEIAGNAFFEYPIPNLDPPDGGDDIKYSEIRQPGERPLQSSSRRLLRTSQFSNLRSNFELGAHHGMNDSGGNVKHQQSNANITNVVQPAGEMKMKTHWRLQFTNFNLLFPRNSGSEDLVALKIDYLDFFEKLVSQSFDSPSACNDIAEGQEMYYYCMDSGAWLWKSTDDASNTCSPLGCDKDNLVNERCSQSSQMRMASSMVEESWNDIQMNIEPVLSDDYFTSDDDDLDFKDTFEEESYATTGPDKNQHAPTVKAHRTQSSAPEKGPRAHKGIDNQIKRYCVKLEGVDIFCSVANSASIQLPSVKPYYKEHKHFVEIRAGRPVYSIVHNDKSSSTWSAQMWNKVTKVKNNIGIVIDFPKNSMRILVCETQIPSSLSLKISMGEFYLLQSVYFDNLQEKGAFFINDDLKRKLNVNRESITRSISPLQQKESTEKTSKTSIPFPDYGTSDYWVHVRRSIPNMEFLLVRSKICLECDMDTNYFLHEIQSLQYLSSENFPSSQFDNSSNRRIPFASVEISWVSLHVQSNDTIMQVALGSSGLRIRDIRGSHVNFAPIICDISRGIDEKTYHGYADFDFGLKESQYCLSNTMDIPVKVSYFNACNWKTINIGLDVPNLDMKNLDTIWLLTDFFSCYYTYSEFGNPSVIAYNICAPSVLPYGGLDCRLFVKKPHIQTRESNFEQEQILFVEADTGFFVRYMYDTQNSARMEILAQDVAIVLMQSYCSPARCRGIRGTTGSGHGTRTIIENFTISYSNQFDHTLKQVDNLLAIVPSSREEDKKDNGNNVGDSVGGHNRHLSVSGDESQRGNYQPYINFDDDSLVLPSCSVNSPKCVSALGEPSRDFPLHSCSVVSSYEDLIFASKLISEFVGIEEVAEDDCGSESKEDELDDAECVDMLDGSEEVRCMLSRMVTAERLTHTPDETYFYAVDNF